MYSLVVFQGPSASGKSFLQAMLGLPRVVTWTSRLPRSGEQHGRDYFFSTKEHMADMLEQGLLLEMTEYQGQYYGTHMDTIKEIIRSGRVHSIVLDTAGVTKIKQLYADAIFVIGITADKEECRQRLMARALPDEEVDRRLQSYEAEREGLSGCDIIIHNSDDNREKAERMIRYLKEGMEKEGYIRYEA